MERPGQAKEREIDRLSIDVPAEIGGDGRTHPVHRLQISPCPAFCPDVDRVILISGSAVHVKVIEGGEIIEPLLANAMAPRLL